MPPGCFVLALHRLARGLAQGFDQCFLRGHLGRSVFERIVSTECRRIMANMPVRPAIEQLGSKLDDIHKLRDAAYSTFGEVAVLMNNAGTSPGGGPWVHTAGVGWIPDLHPAALRRQGCAVFGRSRDRQKCSSARLRTDGAMERLGDKEAALRLGRGGRPVPLR